MNHSIVSYTSPLYNTILDIRYNINWVWKREAIMKQSYLGDCSARNSYDELRDNLEV